MKAMQVRLLNEADLDFALRKAGGQRLHEDPTVVTVKAADYRLGTALIELKMLNDEGFAKPERQQKLAALFSKHETGRPVIVLDRDKLPFADQVRFDRIVETPIKTAIGKASGQLKQSRQDIRDATCSVLMIINNGYTTLDHDALLALVANRARNDTREIDAVVVAGAYYQSDNFDGVLHWPMDCAPINLERPFPEFEKLREGWGALAERFMTDAIRGDLGHALDKGPILDTQFTVDGVTYIRPASIMGEPSNFWIRGRPRKDSTGLSTCPPVGLTFPALTEAQWRAFDERLASVGGLYSNYAGWKEKESRASQSGKPLTPAVTIPVSAEGWEEWCAEFRSPKTARSVSAYANALFSREVHRRIADARELESDMIFPPRYVVVITEIIGQDRANDISHIALARTEPDGNPMILPLVENARIFHEHALAVAAAYAFREHLDHVIWKKELRYAWV